MCDGVRLHDQLGPPSGRPADDRPHHSCNHSGPIALSLFRPPNNIGHSRGRGRLADDYTLRILHHNEIYVSSPKLTSCRWFENKWIACCAQHARTVGRGHRSHSLNVAVDVADRERGRRDVPSCGRTEGRKEGEKPPRTHMAFISRPRLRVRSFVRSFSGWWRQ